MNIAIVCATVTPIPATKGGATETMMTHLLEVNDMHNYHHFHVLSYYEEQAVAISHKFKNSTFYYYNPKRLLEHFEGIFWRFLRKCSDEQIYLRSRYVRWCADIIQRSNFDIIVVEGNCFQVEYLRSLVDDSKIILHMHIDRINKELKAAERIINASDGIFAISQFCKNRMMEVNPKCDQKVVVVKNTIDTEMFQYRGDNVKLQIRHKIGVRFDQKVVSFCGRLDPTKGVLELIRSIKLLNDPKIHLLIIGSSAYFGSGKNKYIYTIEQEAKELVGNVTFTGYIPQSELPLYLSASDIAIVPSLCLEAAGNVTIEALSCGIPVIASAQGGIPEYADTKACRLVEYNEHFVENLAKEINKLLYNDEIYNNLKCYAREVALQYDKHNYYINFCNAVKKIIKL